MNTILEIYAKKWQCKFFCISHLCKFLNQMQYYDVYNFHEILAKKKFLFTSIEDENSKQLYLKQQKNSTKYVHSHKKNKIDEKIKKKIKKSKLIKKIERIRTFTNRSKICL